MRKMSIEESRARLADAWSKYAQGDTSEITKLKDTGRSLDSSHEATPPGASGTFPQDQQHQAFQDSGASPTSSPSGEDAATAQATAQAEQPTPPVTNTSTEPNQPSQPRTGNWFVDTAAGVVNALRGPNEPPKFRYVTMGEGASAFPVKYVYDPNSRQGYYQDIWGRRRSTIDTPEDVDAQYADA